VRSRKHRWIERIIAFGGLAYWLLTTYVALALAGALLTSLTDLSTLRVFTVLALVLAAFGALVLHRWLPAAARFAHWAMLGAIAVTLATCSELVELPPQYVAEVYRGVQIEYADDDVGRALPQIHDLIDQVYARSGLSEPEAPLRMRFQKNVGGRPVQIGDWSAAGAGGADIALTTERGSTRGTSFILEGSFLLTEGLAQRTLPMVQQGSLNGFAYWTMLGMSPRPDWATRWLKGDNRENCSSLARVDLEQKPVGELTIWLPNPQASLHLNVAPFIDAERVGGPTAAYGLFKQSSRLDQSGWRAVVEQHCGR